MKRILVALMATFIMLPITIAPNTLAAEPAINLDTLGCNMTDYLKIVNGSSGNYKVTKGDVAVTGWDNVPFTTPLILTTGGRLVNTRVAVLLTNTESERLKLTLSNMKIYSNGARGEWNTSECALQLSQDSGDKTFVEITLEGENEIRTEKNGTTNGPMNAVTLFSESDVIIKGTTGNQDVLKVLNNSDDRTRAGILIERRAVLTIKSGTIYASTLGTAGGAIRFFNSGSPTLNIEGGIVSAYAHNSVAIGRDEGVGDTFINISGGEVYAYSNGDQHAVAIGAGRASSHLAMHKISITGNAKVLAVSNDNKPNSAAIGVGTDSNNATANIIIDNTAQVLALSRARYRAIADKKYTETTATDRPSIKSTTQGTMASIAMFNRENKGNELKYPIELRGISGSSVERLFYMNSPKWMTVNGEPMEADVRYTASVAFSARASIDYGFFSEGAKQEFAEVGESSKITTYTPTQGVKSYEIIGNATGENWEPSGAQAKRNGDTTWKSIENRSIYAKTGDALSAIATTNNLLDSDLITARWEVYEGSSWKPISPISETYTITSDDLGKKFRGKVAKGVLSIERVTQEVEVIEDQFSITENEGDGYSIKVRVPDRAEAASLMVAAYNNKNILLRVQVYPLIMGDGAASNEDQKTKIFSGYSDISHVRAFLMDLPNNLTPILPSVPY